MVTKIVPFIFYRELSLVVHSEHSVQLKKYWSTYIFFVISLQNMFSTVAFLALLN